MLCFSTFSPVLPMEFSNWLFVLRVHVHYTIDGIRDSNLLNLVCTVERMRLRCREPLSHFHQLGSTNCNWTMYFISNISGAYRIGHCVRARARVCVCVCVCERERERERECAWRLSRNHEPVVTIPFLAVFFFFYEICFLFSVTSQPT